MEFADPVKSPAENVESVRVLLAATINISASLPNASETDPTGTGLGQFIVRRSGSLTHSLAVFYHARSDSTATSAADYIALSGSVKIAAHNSFARINVVPVDDNEPEPTEAVVVSVDLKRGAHCAGGV